MSDEKKRHYKFKEVCVRLAEGATLYSDRSLTDPKSAVDVMRDELAMLDREMLCVINLNSKLNPINFNVVSIGTLNSAPAEVSNVFKSAILSNSSSILVMHNHPSGSYTPSEEDIVMTKRLVVAGQLLNIGVLDHIIVGGQNGGLFSMRNNSTVDFETAFDLKKMKKLLFIGTEEKASVVSALKSRPDQSRTEKQTKTSCAER